MRSNKAKGFFVTGTDTHIGKTTVTSMMIRQLQQTGYQVLGCKPIATGINSNGLNDDAAVYLQINSLQLSQQLINPIVLSLPVSPNIAAKVETKTINLQDVLNSCKFLLQLPVDYIFVEGLGGWKVPLNDRETTVDLATSLGLPIILVVGIRLGCINHAILTYEAMVSSNLPMAGWIANVITPDLPAVDEHITTLKQYLKIPFLGKIDYQKT